MRMPGRHQARVANMWQSQGSQRARCRHAACTHAARRRAALRRLPAAGKSGAPIASDQQLPKGALPAITGVICGRPISALHGRSTNHPSAFTGLILQPATERASYANEHEEETRH